VRRPAGDPAGRTEPVSRGACGSRCCG